jgi:hypothetical protein
MMKPMNDPILKNLTILYWHALRHDKWQVALQVVEQHIKYASSLERQSRSSPLSPKAMRREEMKEPQLKEFIAELEKLYPELKDLGSGLENLALHQEHPPPASA